MKLAVVVVDLEIPPRVKKWVLRLGIPVAVLLGAGAIAYAAGLVTWMDGQTLTAADLNNNFSQLQSEITAQQAQIAALLSGSPTIVQQGTVTNAATIPIMNLSGDTDLQYELEMQGTITTTADLSIYLTMNSDITPGDYYSHEHRQDAVPNNIVENSSSLAGVWIARTVYSTTGTLSSRTIIFAQSGVARQVLSSNEFYASQTQSGLHTLGGTWNNSTAPITQMTVNFNGGFFTGKWRLHAVH
jgi:hypothetical protein